MKLVMTLLVRDGEEILEENIEFHLAQGVDYFIVTDNLSVDGTRGLIEKYVRLNVAEYIAEPGDDFSQARWVTRMARLAATKHAADWVINSDDDEFWSGCGGSLRNEIAALAPHCHAISVQRRDHPPVRGMRADRFLAAMIYREAASTNSLGQPLQPKVLHRAFADIEVDQGNHAVRRSGAPLIATPAKSIRISHFPIRGYASFERKIIAGGAAYARNTELPSEIGQTWRLLYDIWRAGRLREWYDCQLLDAKAITRGIEEGRLFEDHFVLNMATLLGGN